MTIEIGQTASLEKTFTKADVINFSELSCDVNPIHLDEQYAATSIFKKPICHGFLCSSLISAVIANKLPGIGSIYLSQNLEFKNPVFFNDTVKAIVEVTDIRADKKIIFLKTTCYNQDNEIVIDGTAVIKFPLLTQLSQNND